MSITFPFTCWYFISYSSCNIPCNNHSCHYICRVFYSSCLYTIFHFCIWDTGITNFMKIWQTFPLTHWSFISYSSCNIPCNSCSRHYICRIFYSSRLNTIDRFYIRFTQSIFYMIIICTSPCSHQCNISRYRSTKIKIYSSWIPS